VLGLANNAFDPLLQEGVKPQYARTGCTEFGFTTGDSGRQHGAVMETSGRNQWQRVANVRGQKRHKQAKAVAVGCHPLPFGAHGKEWVEGEPRSHANPKMRRAELDDPQSARLDSRPRRRSGYGANTDVASLPLSHSWFDRTLWQGSTERIVVRFSNKKAPVRGFLMGGTGLELADAPVASRSRQRAAAPTTDPAMTSGRGALFQGVPSGRILKP
jgi:hypothetical protein